MNATSCFAIHLNYRTSRKYQTIQIFHLLQNVNYVHILHRVFLCYSCNLYFVFYVGYTVHDYWETCFKCIFRARVLRKWITTTTNTWLARLPNIPSFNWREWKTNTQDISHYRRLFTPRHKQVVAKQYPIPTLLFATFRGTTNRICRVP